jgi:hypothetical protein
MARRRPELVEGIGRIGADYFCANSRDSHHPRFALIDVDWF